MKKPKSLTPPLPLPPPAPQRETLVFLLLFHDHPLPVLYLYVLMQRTLRTVHLPAFPHPTHELLLDHAVHPPRSLGPLVRDDVIVVFRFAEKVFLNSLLKLRRGHLEVGEGLGEGVLEMVEVDYFSVDE